MKFKIGDRVRCTITCPEHDDVYVRGTVTQGTSGSVRFVISWDAKYLTDHVRYNFFPKYIICLNGYEDFEDRIRDRMI